MSRYEVRPITEPEFDLAAKLISDWQASFDSNFQEASVEELQMFFTSRGDMAGHTNLLFENGSKKVVGVAGILEDPVRSKFWTETAALPGTEFIDDVVEECIKTARRLHPDWKLEPVVNDLDLAQISSWQKRSFSKIQTTYSMLRENLSTDFPTLPTGASMRTLRTENDWISIHALQHDAFEGHFGFAPRSLESFKAFRLDSSTYDPEGIIILSLNGEDIGYIEVTSEIEHLNKGFVNIIGVKHSNHKQGWGKLLLNWAFSYSANKGYEGVELFVDIANKSGALKFYEDAGMKQLSAFSTYSNPAWAN